MKKVAIDAVENSIQPAAVMRKLTAPLGTTDVAINYYELEPGDSFAFAFHRHELQEEVFYVQEGTATFDVASDSIDVASDSVGVEPNSVDGEPDSIGVASESIDVHAGELVRFAPGEFQRGWNRGDERVVALALGAPLAYGEQTKLRDCETCGTATDNVLERRPDPDAAGGEVVVATCTECGSTTGTWCEGSMPGTVP